MKRSPLVATSRARESTEPGASAVNQTKGYYESLVSETLREHGIDPIEDSELAEDLIAITLKARRPWFSRIRDLIKAFFR